MKNNKGRSAIAAISETDVAAALEPSSIEMERLRLEIDRLQLENERLAASAAKAAYGASANPDALSFGISAICVVAAICLLFGGIIGFSSGFDIGLRRSPAPQKVLVSKQFAKILECRHSGSERQKPRESATWIPRKTPGAPSNIILTR
jgi:hypothetical protein